MSRGRGRAFFWRAQASACASVPVGTCCALVAVDALAFTCTGIPVVVFRASLFFALAAALVGVPVESVSAVVGQAAALAVLSIFVLEPERASGAGLGLTFPSAGAGVPVLAVVRTTLGVRGEAEAFTACVVPVLERTASIGTSGLDADALAVLVIPELTISAVFGLAHAIAVIFAPSETSGALFGLASAAALFNVEDLVVTANLGSASASSDTEVIEMPLIIAGTNQGLALAGSGAPVVVVTGS